MKESALKLQDKTVLLTGPFNGVTQAIVRQLTEYGADVALVCSGNAGRYVDGVNEAREVHPHYGRAAHFNHALTDENKIRELFGQVVGTLGRMDVLIDATPLAWNASTDSQAASQICLLLADQMIPFFLAKQRGRIVYLLEDPCVDSLRKDGSSPGRSEVLTSLIETLANKHRTQNVMINALSLGVSDDFVLRCFPNTVSIKRSFEELAKANPGLKLVDVNDAASSVAYLSSALCTGLTGQMLRLTQGFHL